MFGTWAEPPIVNPMNSIAPADGAVNRDRLSIARIVLTHSTLRLDVLGCVLYSRRVLFCYARCSLVKYLPGDPLVALAE